MSVCVGGWVYPLLFVIIYNLSFVEFIGEFFFFNDPPTSSFIEIFFGTDKNHKSPSFVPVIKYQIAFSAIGQQIYHHLFF